MQQKKKKEKCSRRHFIYQRQRHSYFIMIANFFCLKNCLLVYLLTHVQIRLSQTEGGNDYLALGSARSQSFNGQGFTQSKKLGRRLSYEWIANTLSYESIRPNLSLHRTFKLFWHFFFRITEVHNKKRIPSLIICQHISPTCNRTAQRL